MPLKHTRAKGYFYDEPIAPPWLELEEGAPVPRLRGGEGLSTEPAKTVKTISEALYARHKVCVTTKEETCVIHPHFLSHFSRDILLFAYCPEKAALINYPLRSITAAEAIPEFFFDPMLSTEKLKYGEGWIDAGTLYKVELCFPGSPAWTRNLVLAGEQEVEWLGKNTIISFTTDDLECVRALVLFLGGLITVRRPVLLRSTLRRHLSLEN